MPVKLPLSLIKIQSESENNYITDYRDLELKSKFKSEYEFPLMIDA